MANQYILALDQGTTGSTALIIDQNLNVKAKFNQEFTQFYPKPGWVEHDANQIWQTTLNTIQTVLKKAKIKAQSICAIGITNQRETVVLWDKKTTKPVTKAIVWQDRRTADFCHKHKNKNSWVRKKTGLVLDPYFSATKLRFLFQKNKSWLNKAKKGELCFGTIDSFLLAKLTGGKVHQTDVSNASRTLLMNLKTRKWDDELLKFFGIPQNCLPKIAPNATVYGTTSKVLGLPDGIPISGMAGDQQAALFGQTCFDVGDAKCTYGTGSFLLMNIGKKPLYSKHGLLTSVAWQLKDQTDYALEGSSFIAGAAVQWLRDGLGLIKKASDIEALALKEKNPAGVWFVPALSGLGAPFWQPEAKGVFWGITRGTNRSHLAYAVLNGIAHRQADILQAMSGDTKRKLKSLKVDGGASMNNFLMQNQANLLGTKVIRPKMVETTALGAAMLAGLGVGLWSSPKQIKKIWQKDQTFSPKISPAKRKALQNEWLTMVKKA